MPHLTDLPRDVLSSIEESLEDRGELRAEEIELGWGLTPEQSERVLRHLSKRRDVERGRNRVLLRQRPSRSAEEEEERRRTGRPR